MLAYKGGGSPTLQVADCGEAVWFGRAQGAGKVKDDVRPSPAKKRSVFVFVLSSGSKYFSVPFRQNPTTYPWFAWDLWQGNRGTGASPAAFEVTVMDTLMTD